MTFGITGVFWLPRTATVNSTTLWAGAGPIPLSTAAPAWSAIAAAYGDASFTVTRVLAELAVGWQGITSVGALARLGGFKIWADQAAATAIVASTKAGANAIASTTARVVMPSLPEIVAVQTAKAVAYTTGGVLNGTAEVAEAADRAMDLRAALVMEAYEAATTTVVVTPTEFVPPPPIANGLSEAGNADAAQQGSTNPVQAAALAAGAFLQNPAVQSAAAQAGQIAGSTASTAVSVASNVGSNVASAMTAPGTSTPFMGSPMSGPLGGRGDSNPGSSVRAVSYPSGMPGATGISLPEGWGQHSSPIANGSPAPAAPGATPPPQPGLGPIGTADSAATRAASSGGPMLGHRGADASDDDDEHSSPDYLKNFEHFADGRTVIPSVIGAESEHAR
ncbi:PPE domain-containing protein [Antrihabitans sp. YC3-6]|uniref:PPE domain-containing protein n=1 Tax=Antrihabitans stalagmiti TaxID=2799499 RepID=A0A934U3X8_9NOCA|nr:PPE domain-containing protein [Antrihabitans stalagmiti]MBJ8339872.1 PPE domain-containing protein [Antrihabitans stalagmiti]